MNMVGVPMNHSIGKLSRCTLGEIFLSDVGYDSKEFLILELVASRKRENLMIENVSI